MARSAMQKRHTPVWMAGSFAVALAIAFVAREAAAPGDKLEFALKATARCSFLLFWLAYAGAPLATVFGVKFRALAQRGRDFGLAFASAHLVHLALVAWLLRNATTPFPRPALTFLSIGVLWIYLLMILSFKPLGARLDQGVLRLLRIVGVEYIAMVFLIDFAKNPLQGGVASLIAYLPFQILAVGGLLLKVASIVKRLSAWTISSRRLRESVH
jgi:hypothetical protein